MIGKMAGSYRIVGKIGSGGMGAVFLAEHPLLGKQAAVKVLLPAFSAMPTVVQRFFNEARATTALEHPGIIEIFDFGVDLGGSAYIVMELLVGESLGDRFRRERKLSTGLVIEIGRQVALALGAAHAKGIIHRDIKPDNIFLVADPELPSGIRAKVLDFGIAKLTGEIASAGEKTQTDAVMGTTAYMSPEQCRGAARVDRRTDVYALGCVMFKMLAGKAPYEGGHGEVIAAHLIAPVPSLEGVVGPELDAVLRRMLAKNPDDRPDTMAELAFDLQQVAKGRRSTGPYRVVARPVEIDLALDETGANSGAMPTNGTLSGAAAEARAPYGGNEERWKRWPWLGTGAAVMVSAVVASIFVATRGPIAPKSSMTVVPSVGSAASNAAPSATSAQPVEVVPGATAAPPGPAAPPARAVTIGGSAPAAAPAPRAPSVAPSDVIAERVHFQMDSRPQGAAVYRASDGARVGTTPYTEAAVPIERDVEFVLKLPGYPDARVSFDGSRDGVRAATFARKTPPTGAHRAAPPARKAEPTPGQVKGGVIDPFAE